jgi:hypothetical protein
MGRAEGGNPQRPRSEGVNVKVIARQPVQRDGLDHPQSDEHCERQTDTAVMAPQGLQIDEKRIGDDGGKHTSGDNARDARVNHGKALGRQRTIVRSR